MKLTSFAELTKEVHLINDLILSDMIYGNEDEYAEESHCFKKHLLATKYWFTRISFANKKRYVLALLEDVRSALTLSLLLKSMWNCRPKDAVLSACESIPWSSYDQAPMDHNRTAQDLKVLAQVMTQDRKWFHSLYPEYQVMVLSELLTVSGGPVMWAVLKRALAIYERYKNQQMRQLTDSTSATSLLSIEKDPVPSSAEKGQSGKKATQARLVSEKKSAEPRMPVSGAQVKLEESLVVWNAAIKVIRDNQKLEEIELLSTDGSKRKVWKVNRPKPEGIETVDFIQLLPSSIGKRILSYLPRAQLGEYAKVNKYWAFLAEELVAELNARQKINAELDKLQDLMLKYDTSMEVLVPTAAYAMQPSSIGVSIAHSVRMKAPASMRASERSAGAMSFRHLLDTTLKLQIKKKPKPIRNLAELTERLDRRGAADENLWTWCENVLKQVKKDPYKEQQKADEGVFRFGDNVYFPCPMMKLNLELPLTQKLHRDPSLAAVPRKLRRNTPNAKMLNLPKEEINTRYSVWSRDLSGFYKVYKVASHLSPF